MCPQPRLRHHNEHVRASDAVSLQIGVGRSGVRATACAVMKGTEAVGANTRAAQTRARGGGSSRGPSAEALRPTVRQPWWYGARACAVGTSGHEGQEAFELRLGDVPMQRPELGLVLARRSAGGPHLVKDPEGR
jgi:hypothetical protein